MTITVNKDVVSSDGQVEVVASTMVCHKEEVIEVGLWVGRVWWVDDGRG